MLVLLTKLSSWADGPRKPARQ